MIDRRTFLKLSAGALVLTAAGALTGCGDTVIEKTSGVAKIGDVTFICATPFLGGGVDRQLTYWTQFTIQNNSAERVVIKPKDITWHLHAIWQMRSESAGISCGNELISRAGADGRLAIWQFAEVLSANK
ncbi:MAG: twin-arginine translocation signal domain-containing protein [Faecalibacterium sp.]